MKKNISLLILISCYINYGLAQFKMEYASKSILYPNSLFFEKENRFSSQGTFKDRVLFDDLSGKLGKGNFVETKRFFILTYNLPPYNRDTIVYRYNPKRPNNTIGVRFVDFWEEDDEYGGSTIQVLDSLTNKIEFYLKSIDHSIGHIVAIIPIDSLGFRYKIINNFPHNIIGLNIPNGMNDVIIVRNYINGYRALTYHDQPIKLKKLSGGRLEDEKGRIFIKVKD